MLGGCFGLHPEASSVGRMNLAGLVYCTRSWMIVCLSLEDFLGLLLRLFIKSLNFLTYFKINDYYI